MAALSKPKFRIKRNPDYRGMSGYAWDNGHIAFSDPLEQLNLKGAEKERHRNAMRDRYQRKFQ